MSLSRRAILKASGVAAVTVASGARVPEAVAQGGDPGSWEWLRGLFDLSPDTVHMSSMLLASHPRPVREAIEEHRRALDADPVRYLARNDNRLTAAARQAAGEYLGIHSSHVALTDSTTMGVGLVYTGLKLRPGDDVLTTTEDYYVTHESLRLAAERTGAAVRKIPLFERVEEASEDEIVTRIVEAVRPRTRLVALTWVHSNTGLKLPVAAVAAALREVNAERDEEDQVLLGLDAVHGFGVEDARFAELGCDFFMAGCHKWLFGPRGTGIAALSDRGLALARPSIPSFTDDAVFSAWLQEDGAPPGGNSGPRMTPGGFKPFEHIWALPEAFALHSQIGRERVAERTHVLAGALKDALSGLPNVAVRTPRDASLSAGIVSFDVEGAHPEAVVSSLRSRNIIASAAPYAVQHVRLTPSIRNSEGEIERVAAALREIV
ncbi:aminotransferase class V-fold PLP-dependent enzyme [Chelativorans salis]|uniref:Aminotransferase class V-fold PLP-dependent enzyme n=1 Tax=Chelativorans salis TaxID=2978478 RepID=A0ABT2LX05_9HYPH|nr:aminotransferase class V-fold PLP-dependent enzyme [Chelativorans sp. EGI FJ00035]MCT7378402.1 aminotransferase class V-fold PLP-dependent enzyme [Chelativorans sp. EGI FJ00035]